MNKNLYVRTAVLNKMTCAVSLQLQNFRRVYVQVLLFKFRQCEDYSEQSKPNFEPLTFAWQRCFYFNVSILTSFVFIFIEYLYCSPTVIVQNCSL